MTADKKRNQNLVQHLALSDDDLADLLDNCFAHRVEALDALLQLCDVGTECSRRSHLSPLCESVGFCRYLLQFQQQFLRGTIAGSRFQRRQHAFLSFVFLAGGKVRLRQLKLGACLIQRT